MDAISITVSLSAGILSGIGGIFLQKYWSNKAPVVQLTSVAFEGPLVKVPQDLVETTKTAPWGKVLDNFETFEALIKYEQQQGIYSEGIEQAKSLVEDWLKKHQDDLEKEYMPKSTLEACPYFHTPIIGSSLYGHLRRRKQLQLPIEKIEIENEKKLLEIHSENEKEIVLHLGYKGVKFPISEDFGDDQKRINQLVAYSFLTGNSKNISWLMSDFINSASREVIEVEKIRKALQGLLTKNAVLKFGVTLTNKGADPQLIKPYGAVNVKFGDSNKLLLVEHKHINDEKPDLEQFLIDQARTSKKPTNVPTFINKIDKSPHILVPGHSSIDVTFVSIEGNDSSEKIIDFYRLGGVSAIVMVESINNSKLTSPVTSFAHSLNEDRQETLREAANKAIKRTR
ncbi:TPA: hypothetical protein NGU08_004355 [Vibrio parahaemolyticus]|nr:hypothetical protein [Vibrio parahaemolyticus]